MGDIGAIAGPTFHRLLDRSPANVATQFSMSAAGKMLAGAAPHREPVAKRSGWPPRPPDEQLLHLLASVNLHRPTALARSIPAHATAALLLTTPPGPPAPTQTFRARASHGSRAPQVALAASLADEASWLSPPSLAREAYDPSTLSQAFEGSCTSPAAPNVSGALLVPPGRWPSAIVCDRRPSFYLSDGATQRPPALPGWRRLRCSAGGPTSFGDLPSPGLGPLAAAPPLRPMPPTFSTRRSPVTRDFAPTQGFKQRGAQVAELSMPANRHPDRCPSPLVGGCSTSHPAAWPGLVALRGRPVPSMSRAGCPRGRLEIPRLRLASAGPSAARTWSFGIFASPSILRLGDACEFPPVLPPTPIAGEIRSSCVRAPEKSRNSRRTQGAAASGAKCKPEDTAAGSVSGADSGARGASKRPQYLGSFPVPAVGTVHVCLSSTTICRGAVTRQGAALAASPKGLTAVPADNPNWSACDAVHPADLSASVTAPHTSHLSRTTTHASSLTSTPGAPA